MNSQASLETDAVFQLKGGLFALTSIQLLNPSLAPLSEQLDHKLQQAPKFFNNAPIVLDLQKVNRKNVFIDFMKLKKIIESKNLIPVGIKNGSAEQNIDAIAAGFAILQENVKESEREKEKKQSIPTESVVHHSEEAHIRSTSKVITEPVRSGQQIYARGGDLIVLAPVGHGAELLADGHIHVYAPLRGRALAGVTGDHTARIFCQSLEAELISIAGSYQISEDIESEFFQKSVEISFRDGRLHIRTL